MLKVENLSIAFHSRNGRKDAVKNVSFSLEPGKILAIVGESGSGKSVTCYSLLGLIPSPPGKIESGTAIFNGQDLLKMSNKELRKIRGAKIGMIFQDPMTSLNPFKTIGEQIIESLELHQKSSKSKRKELAINALNEVGISDAENRLRNYPHEFSGGMRQRVMIAMALATEPEILIADEPTTALDVTIQAQILELLNSIQKKRNLSIIFISHDLAVVKNIADHVLVMRDGEVVEEGNPVTLFENAQHPYTQKLLAAIPTTGRQYSQAIEEAPLITASGINKTFTKTSGSFRSKKTQIVNAAQDIQLDLYPGEILGVVGESGSGKSTMGRIIVRLLDPDSGVLNYRGKDLLTLDNKALKAIRSDIQMVFQDPYASLNPRMTVYETLAEPLILHNKCEKSDIDQRIDQLLTEVGLEKDSRLKYPHEFSGGQRQRIAIARALACEPKIIVADEPVSALDVTIQAQVLDLLLKLNKEKQLTLLFISHDLAVVRYLCDRVIVMKQGKIIERGWSEDVFNEPNHEYTQKLLSAIPSL